jgi:phospholipid transport system substrate-binding protein
MISILRRGLLVLLAACPCWLTLRRGTARSGSGHHDLLADLKANKEQYKQPRGFYAALNRIVGPVVDADGISKSIMTVKYSRKATPEQMQRFQENFKKA